MLKPKKGEGLCRRRIPSKGKGFSANRRGLGPFTLPEIVLYIVSAIAMLIFILVLRGYAANTVPKMSIPNEDAMLANNIADALISLPNWDGECGCLAKSTITSEGEIIYPGLIPKWKLDKMNTGVDCDYYTYFCTVPYFIDQDLGAYVSLSVYDLEDGAYRLHLPSVDTIGTARGMLYASMAAPLGPFVGLSAFSYGLQHNITVTRLVAIEYETGVVHAGKMSIAVFY